MQKHFPTRDWIISLPPGSGMETYFVRSGERQYFVKVGVSAECYLVMAEIGLTPPVVDVGELDSGISIIVQPRVPGWNPSRRDYREQLESVAEFVDRSLVEMESQIQQFSTNGLVASHNDICNANWLFAADGNIYIVDLESMSMGDPAFDIGALLWWYYPPELRDQFLDLAGYKYDDEFKSRMQVRMAIHCLSITLPTEQSFDRLSPEHYHEALEDFSAVLGGRENPQGYTS